MSSHPRELNRPITPQVRRIAAELSALFDRDRELCRALNDAHGRLDDANDQLTAGLSAEALRAIYGPAGPDLGRSGRKPPVLEAESVFGALESVAQRIRSTFIEYQSTAELRRQLAFEVGDVNARLVAAMASAGFTEAEACAANVHVLAIGRYEASGA